MERQVSGLRSFSLTGKAISAVVKISGSMGINVSHYKQNSTETEEPYLSSNLFLI